MCTLFGVKVTKEEFNKLLDVDKVRSFDRNKVKGEKLKKLKK